MGSSQQQGDVALATSVEGERERKRTCCSRYFPKLCISREQFKMPCIDTWE